MTFCASIDLGLQLLACLHFVVSERCDSSCHVLFCFAREWSTPERAGFPCMCSGAVVCDFYIDPERVN